MRAFAKQDDRRDHPTTYSYQNVYGIIVYGTECRLDGGGCRGSLLFALDPPRATAMTEYVQAIHSGTDAGDALGYQSVFGYCARVPPPLPSLPGAGPRL